MNLVWWRKANHINTRKIGGRVLILNNFHATTDRSSNYYNYDVQNRSNRQFRYEERDNGGNVHGHYGYLDNDGKMQVYNYSSHPELGYRAQKAETLEVWQQL